jgi:hypothetical protein
MVSCGATDVHLPPARRRTVGYGRGDARSPLNVALSQGDDMNRDPQDPIGMVPDPLAGDLFVFPSTKCTRERRLFFKRANEIHALLFITKHAYDETNKIYQQRIRNFPKREHTPVKIELNTGHSMIFPAALILRLSNDAINILTRQAFIMFYGSFETYLFQIFERSFPVMDIKDEILDRSITVLMGGKWDGKFNKMSENFGLGFKAGELNQHFSEFELNFEGKVYKNPLLFMDELAKVRHRIVHASSILDKDQLISVDLNVFHAFYGFYFLLTDFVDALVAKRFDYPRPEMNPSAA